MFLDVFWKRKTPKNAKKKQKIPKNVQFDKKMKKEREEERRRAAWLPFCPFLVSCGNGKGCVGLPNFWFWILGTILYRFNLIGVGFHCVSERKCDGHHCKMAHKK